MTTVHFHFEGARHRAHLDENNIWWREDGVHYSLNGHKPSSVYAKVSPLIAMRSGSVVRITGEIAFEYEDYDGPEQSYYDSLGKKVAETLVDGESFLRFIKRAQDKTFDFGWFNAQEIFVYKAYPLSPEAARCAWRAFFWTKRREIIQNLSL